MIIINSLYNSVNFDELNGFVFNHPNGNFFQSSAYYNFIKSLPLYESVLITANDENGNLSGSLIAVIQKEKGHIKGKLSSRCIVIGGPLVKDNNKDTVDFLLKELIKNVSSKSIYIEFRNLFDLSIYKEVFEKNRFEYKEHFNFNLEILHLEANLKKLNKTRRWEINKSLKEGASIVEAKDLNEVKEFYLMLKNLYKQKIKKPLPAFSFFENFFLTPTLGKYFLVKFNENIIGGTMCPIFKETIYEWYEYALDKEYKNLYPGSLATWAPIEYATKNSLKCFDFLGAGSADSVYGVREFKSKFGGELVNYGRFLRINNKLLYNVGKLGLRVLQKIK